MSSSSLFRQTVISISIEDGQSQEFQSFDSLAFTNFVFQLESDHRYLILSASPYHAEEEKNIRRVIADHTVSPKCKPRMNIFRSLNEVLDNEYDSTKVLIPTDVFDRFKEMYHT